MERFEKTKALHVKRADPASDIALINQYSQRELAPEEVYCFSVVLCDNDVDRDDERFTDSSLRKLAKLFVARPAIFDHVRSAKNQVARLYRVEVEDTAEKTALGEPLKRLRGSAYMLKTEATQSVIEAIEGGILKEVSISCAVSKQTCSCCGEAFSLDPRDWKYRCGNGHEKGRAYGEKRCVGNLEEPLDAYEFSFVAVPAQRGAGVTKSAEDVNAAFDTLLAADLSPYTSKIKALIPHFQIAVESDREREVRALILEENKKFL